jgi:beta-lactam-binding protein with PASTA domain
MRAFLNTDTKELFCISTFHTVFEFITKRPLWVNLLAGLSLLAIVVILFLQLLGWITRHGEYMKVPAVLGKNTKEAVAELEKLGFEVVIQDSVYREEEKKGIVLKQLPDPNSTVKVNRKVFLTVNRETLPKVDMPQLEGKTLGFALDILERSHLKLGDTVFRADFMRGSVLEQLYLGKRIASGIKVPWGSKISLVVGSGLNNEQLSVPNLLGLTMGEGRILLEENGLILGALIADPGITDTAAAFIYQQSPSTLSDDGEPILIQSGQLMDLWISPVQRVQADTIK